MTRPKEYSKLWKKITFWLAFKGGHREKRIHGQATKKIDKSYRRLSAMGSLDMFASLSYKRLEKFARIISLI